MKNMDLSKSELGQAIYALRKAFYLVGIFSMVSNIMLLVPTLYMLQVFDRVMLSQSVLTLVFLSIITLFLFSVGSFSEWIRSRVLVSIGSRLDDQLSTRIFNASYDSSLKNPSDKPNRFFDDLLTIRQFLTGNGIFAFFDTPWTFIYWGVLYLLHPILGAIAIVFAIIQAALVWFGHRQIIKPTEIANAASAEEKSYLHSKLRNIDVLIPMGMVSNIEKISKAKHAEAENKQGITQALTHKITAWSKFIRYSQQSLSLGVGALLVIDGQISPGAMIASNALMTRTLAPIDQLANTWKSFINARAAFSRINELLIANPVRNDLLRRVAPNAYLEVNNLIASVPDKEKPIVQIENFRAHPGSVTVVLGPSGSGKSTFARSILGICPYAHGEILLDGLPINGWNRDELGAYLGYLPQDIELFNGTIAENIARFNEIDSNKVISAAQKAGLHDMILHLPNGYDTQIGNSGNILSGGQRQRIALARAIYNDPKLVVLDEPNANLDDVGENALINAVKSLKSNGSTTILITHRPGILAVADYLIYFKDGEVVFYGPRDEIMQKIQLSNSNN